MPTYQTSASEAPASKKAKAAPAKDFKAVLWASADKLRAQMDAAEYKHLVLGLVFLKYISDSFTLQRTRIERMVPDPASDYFVSESPAEYAVELEERDFYKQDNVFWVPPEARWEAIRAKAKQPDIGQTIDAALVAIERENPTLSGKLDKRFGAAQLEPGKLGELVDLISGIGFNAGDKAQDIKEGARLDRLIAANLAKLGFGVGS